MKSNEEITAVRPVTCKWSAVDQTEMVQPVTASVNVPFKRALLQITRKTSEVKALPAFKSMFRLTYKPADPLTDVEKVLADCLEVWRQHGFTADEVEGLRQSYANSPRRGPRKKSATK